MTLVGDVSDLREGPEMTSENDTERDATQKEETQCGKDETVLGLVTDCDLGSD